MCLALTQCNCLCEPLMGGQLATELIYMYCNRSKVHELQGDFNFDRNITSVRKEIRSQLK